MSNLFSESTPAVKRFLFGVLLNSLGSGLTLPILVVYLHIVRGMSLPMASLVLSWMALVGLIVSPALGTLVDRIGPRPVLLFGIICAMVGALSWSFVDSVSSAFIAGAIVSLANAATWPPQTTMVSRMVDEKARQKLFGWQFMMLNLGLGLGGLVSALIVNVDVPNSFTRLFILDAVSYFGYFLIVASLVGIGGRLPIAEQKLESGDGYREVLRDRKFMQLNFASVVMLTCGYASLDAGMPALLTTVGGLSIKMLGPIWAVNTGVIVICQLFVLKRIEGRSRTRLLGVVGILWATCWAFIALALMASPGWMFVIVCIGVAIFALGETIWSPVGPTLANEMAPEHLRGRYAAMSSLVWVVSGAIGPAISGLMIGAKLANQWLGLLVIFGLLAGFMSLRLGKSLTPAQDGILT